MAGMDDILDPLSGMTAGEQGASAREMLSRYLAWAKQGPLYKALYDQDPATRNAAIADVAKNFGMALAPGNIGKVPMAFPGARGRLGKIELADVLAQRQANRPDALPPEGAKGVITPPPHIQSLQDFNGLVDRYSDLVEKGAPAKDWYGRSGQAILEHAGSPEAADAFAAALARTSPGTDVASNTTHALRAHNQAMVGDPISAGRFPNQMGKDIEKTYYGGERPTAAKIGPFMGAIAEEWNPEAFHHQFVNDIWNMRAAEYPGEGANGFGSNFSGTPSAGQHNFTRVLADEAREELARRGQGDLQPKQIQAAAWAAKKAETEGTPITAAGQDFSDALQRSHAQLSWESAPGLTTGHFPEYHSAPLEQRKEFHNAIRGVMTDPNGRDLIAAHLGFMTAPTVDAPGVFQGRVSPGSQGRVAVGQEPGGNNVDAASRDMLTTSEAVRGMLLRQDAAAWHKPVFKASLPAAQANLAEIRMGRPLNDLEAQEITHLMAQQTGGDFFSPIGTPQGFRFLNVPDASGIDNKTFQAHVVRALDGSALLPDREVWQGYADGDYIPNDWKESPLGQDYLARIASTGRPDLQRRAEELLATLGPRVSQVEEDFGRRYGWTPNRATRLWELPAFQDAQRLKAPAQIPSPPEPWNVRPGPDSPGAEVLPSLTNPTNGPAPTPVAGPLSDLARQLASQRIGQIDQTVPTQFFRRVQSDAAD